ncbi:MAG: stage 0 sporulation family protein [Oscillospiraceae bacterium]|nr:stage 0 sporulation family protein [Oscillospiraceae bacterium]
MTTDIIQVRFRSSQKAYSFDPDGIRFTPGESAIVETARGMECGLCVTGNRPATEEELSRPLKKILRKASEKDLSQNEENIKKEQEAFALCQEKIAHHKLDMKLISAEYAFDRSKLLFCFTSDNRVDFRELVKDLAATFRTRIELRQVGVRDEAKLLGGFGICGRPFCCHSFLSEFQPVSIKMAKEQNLSLNPTKISGTCGRLMCCLKYEQEAYEELNRITPRVGSSVRCEQGVGTVVEASPITGKLRVKLDHDFEAQPIQVHRDEVQILRSGRKKSGNNPQKEEKNTPES